MCPQMLRFRFRCENQADLDEISLFLHIAFKLLGWMELHATTLFLCGKFLEVWNLTLGMH